MTVRAAAETETAAGSVEREAVRQAPAAGGAAFVARTVWLWPALVTLALGVRGSWRPELWRDEVATWSAATRSTGGLLDMLQHVDAVSGTYYLLMHFWISGFGDSPTLFRLPSALAMAAAAALVVLAGRKLFGTWPGFFGGMLFAVLPSVSRFAQEGRGYAFAVMSVAAATWLLLRALERPTAPRWLPYALAVVSVGLFHVVALTVLVPHAVVVLMRWWRWRRHRLLIAFSVSVPVALLALVPVIVLGRRQAGRQISWLHSPNLQDFVETWHGMFGSALVSGCMLGLCALPAAWPRGRRPALEIGLVAGVPLVLIWAISQAQTSYFLDRYLLFTLPAWAVLAGAGLTALRPRALIAVGLAGTALLGLQDQQAVRTATSHDWSDPKGAARIIADGYRPGDGIVPVRGGAAYMMLDHALEYYLPRDIHPRDVFVQRSAAAKQDLYADECVLPAACAAGVDRIWVVTYGSPDDPYKQLPDDEVKVLTSEFTRAKTDSVRGLTVTLLERKPAKA
ncbi:glycosyltransferase family 39 protein [Kitasatospora sp. NPDC101176]|uniref:glycosyltransferase family 39 protein n=1 Tax=Kitasatospora sp. NPDC101176 TaxID=3364099 RepID=UPI0038205E31